MLRLTCLREGGSISTVGNRSSLFALIALPSDLRMRAETCVLPTYHVLRCEFGAS